MNDKTAGSSISLTGTLFILLVALKLTGYIDWSWWWVTVPIWGPIAALFGFIVLWLTICFISWAIPGR